MRRVAVAAMVAGLVLGACGGDDAADGDAPVSAAADTQPASTSPDSAGESADTTSAAIEAPVETAPSTEGGSDPGSMVVPGADTDVCAMFTPEELSAVVGMPLEEGTPFFSGVDENSCDWSTPSDSDVIGTVSIRLSGTGSFVLIDETPYPLSGLGDEAEVENKYGQTNVHYGDMVVTFQANGTPAELPDIAAAYPDLAAEPDSVLVSTADSQASVALAQAFAGRFTG